MKLIEFTTPTCVYCKEQKKVLDKFQMSHKDLQVEVLDLFAVPEAQFLFNQCHSSTFPTLAVLDTTETRVVYAEGGLHSAPQVEALLARARAMS